MKSLHLVLGLALVVGLCGNLEARNRRHCPRYENNCYRKTTVNNNYVVVKKHHHHDGVRLAADIIGLVGNSINLLNSLNTPPVIQPTIVQPAVVQPTIVQPTVVQPTVVYPTRVIVRPRYRRCNYYPIMPCRRGVYVY